MSEVKTRPLVERFRAEDIREAAALLRQRGRVLRNNEQTDKGAAFAAAAELLEQEAMR